ncbi:DUF4097 family beta strand repeat-containing protein [Streptomyces sp. NPDC048324]|uniref:DUF4097 family beta strand repeat-containing protein n=1 Tax=Streptomyces sp. NPDC048324 TaxID=3157205 RepID=UPI0034277992
MTTKTFTATADGRIWADVISSIGNVNVTVDAMLKNAEITVRTSDDEGPIADAVRNTTSREHTSNGVNVLEVHIPKINGGGTFIGGGGFSTTTMTVGGNTFTFTGSGGVSMIGNDVYMGGKKIVENGRVIAQQGTVVGGTGNGTITVDVRLPDLSSFRLDTVSGDLKVTGDLQILDVKSTSGDVEAMGVHTLRGNTTSGDFEVTRVDVTSVSGDIEIGAYNGSEFRVNSVSGDVHISATPAATGTLDVSTVSGDVTTRGADHLRPRVSTVSGRHRRR